MANPAKITNAQLSEMMAELSAKGVAKMYPYITDNEFVLCSWDKLNESDEP